MSFDLTNQKVSETYDRLIQKDSGNNYYDGLGNPVTIGAVGKIRRHDFNGGFSYCGTAKTGSLESDLVWIIVRLTIPENGVGIIAESAIDVNWTDRYTHIYT